MAKAGFIHDKLDIKFLVLYLMARVASPVDFSTLADLTFCDDGVEYFDFAAALAELVDTGHLELKDDKYSITEKGRRNGKICESSLAYSVRRKCDRNLAKVNGVLRRDAQVRAEILPRDDGAHTLRLILDDDKGNIMTLDLLTVSEEQAGRLAEKFRTHPGTAVRQHPPSASGNRRGRITTQTQTSAATTFSRGSCAGLFSMLLICLLPSASCNKAGIAARPQKNYSSDPPK